MKEYVCGIRRLHAGLAGRPLRPVSGSDGSLSLPNDGEFSSTLRLPSLTPDVAAAAPPSDGTALHTSGGAASQSGELLDRVGSCWTEWGFGRLSSELVD